MNIRVPDDGGAVSAVAPKIARIHDAVRAAYVDFSPIISGPVHPDRLLSRDEVAYLFGVSKRLLEIKALEGGGPVMVRIGDRQIRYRVADVIAWIESRRVRSTSDTPEAADCGGPAVARR
jgi:predicted DNA-binding transcriptional regulator AlpA